MKNKLFSLLLITIIYMLVAGVAYAEPDNGKFVADREPFAVQNFFTEVSGNVAFPLPFYNEDPRALTGYGGGFNVGLGYNWCGWLLGIEYSRDMWSGGKKAYQLMNYFNSNIFMLKAQRVISKNTIKVFPKWLEIVPGVGVGMNAFGTEYYRSAKHKEHGVLTMLPEFDPKGAVFYMRFSFEVSFPFMEKDYFIPFVGADYNMFFDKSYKGGMAGFPRIVLGFRSYPLLAVKTKERKPKEPKPKKETEPLGATEVTLSTDLQGELTPDGDGNNDKLNFVITTKNTAAAIESWKLDIYDGNHVVRSWNGTKLPKQITWDGKDSLGDIVTSVNAYKAELTVVPSGVDRERSGVAELKSSTEIKTGIILQKDKTGKQYRIVSAPIAFDSDTATFRTISAEMRASNNRIVKEVSEHIVALFANDNIVVEGYANNISNTEAENINELIPLSQSRAAAIMEMMIANGVKREKISAKGMGGANPIAKWEDTENWWRNRRVEFVISVE